MLGAAFDRLNRPAHACGLMTISERLESPAVAWPTGRSGFAARRSVVQSAANDHAYCIPRLVLAGLGPAMCWRPIHRRPRRSARHSKLRFEMISKLYHSVWHAMNSISPGGPWKSGRRRRVFHRPLRGEHRPANGCAETNRSLRRVLWSVSGCRDTPNDGRIHRGNASACLRWRHPRVADRVSRGI